MHREFTFFNLSIILHIVFYGLLLLVAKVDYWAFLDFLTQPLAEFEFIAYDNGNYGPPVILHI